jgi:hypothetical protein
MCKALLVAAFLGLIAMIVKEYPALMREIKIWRM